MTNKAFIIAEAGVNHNGSLELAKKLIRVAAEAGADAVKFQTFKTEKVISRHAQKAEYQKQTTGTEESQFDMVKKLELTQADHRELVACSQQWDIQLLSTPFDVDSLHFLANDLHLPKIKVPSGEVTNAPLLLAVARTGKPVIMSTGMCTLGEIEDALSVLAFGYSSGQDETPGLQAFREAFYSQAGQQALKDKVILLHCTTEYPAPFEDVNLRAMDALSGAFGLPVGFSDHTQGISVPIAAVARGATVIEKHFTLDRTMPGPDHQASLEPDELRQMVKAIREVESALGQAVKLPSKSELKNKAIARKSLVASTAIRAGDPFLQTNLEVKRPGTGISPMRYWDMIGKPAKKEYREDEVIEE